MTGCVTPFILTVSLLQTEPALLLWQFVISRTLKIIFASKIEIPAFAGMKD